MELEVSTGHTGLSHHEMFKLLRETLPPNLLNLKSLMCFNNDILFVWNLHESCLFALNVHSVDSDNKHSYIALIPAVLESNEITTPSKLHFSVNSIKMNELSTFCAIVGAREVAVLEMPACFETVFFRGGTRSIYCKYSSVDKQYFLFNDCTVQQVQWHPAPELDNRLIILTSLNELRIYKIKCGQDIKLISVWSTVSNPSLFPCNCAVDFDIAPPVLENPAEENVELSVLLWPVLVLFKNGDVTIINHLSSKKSRQTLPKVSEPLSFHPSVERNIDACSLLVLSSVPPLVVIAENCGNINHYFLLSESKETQSKNTNQTVEDSSCFLTPALYLLESVEVEQGYNSSTPPERPIYLFKNPALNSQYFCSYDLGVIIVNIPLVSELRVFAETNDNDIDSTLPSLNHSSTCEYLVCTQDNNTSEHQPILGLAVIDSPATLIVFCGNQVLSLPLTSFIVAAALNFSPFKKIEPVKKPPKPAFNELVANLLKSVPSIRQPLLNLDLGSECSLQECLEHVSSVTSTTRKKCFPCLEIVQDLIEKRVSILRIMKMRQFEELTELDKKKDELCTAGKKLLNKCKEASKTQKTLSERAERALKMMSRLQSPPGTVAKRVATDPPQNFQDKIELRPTKRLTLTSHMEINTNKTVNEDTAACSNETKSLEENLVTANNEIRIKEEGPDPDNDLQITLDIPKDTACEGNKKFGTTDGQPSRKKMKINVAKSSVSSSVTENKENEKPPLPSTKVSGTPQESNKLSENQEEECSLFISCIPLYGCNGPIIKAALEPHVGYKKVLSVQCPRNRYTGGPRGFANVVCADKTTALKLRDLNFKIAVCGKKVKIEEFKPRFKPLKISFSNLPQNIMEKAFRTKLLQFIDEADISNIEFPLRKDGKPHGYAFIELKKNEAVKKLLALHQKLEIGGNKLNIRIRSEDSVLIPSQAANKRVNMGPIEHPHTKRSRKTNYFNQTSFHAGSYDRPTASWNSKPSNFGNFGNVESRNQDNGSAQSNGFSNFSGSNSSHRQQNTRDVQKPDWRQKAYEFIHSSVDLNQGAEQFQNPVFVPRTYRNQSRSFQ